ncbi:unnamed protein product [Rotaria sp. Silwood2]|nr:unnamed protein product [Rotaria sp. Silwood2]
MATVDCSSDRDQDDNTDDNNVSDEDEWLKKTQDIADKCPKIPHYGRLFRPNDFFDKRATYGDGGELILKYPIWMFGALSKHISDVSTDVREELLEVFHKLNDERKDFHKYPLPVEDIVDPDLLVCKPIKPLSPPPSPLPTTEDSEDEDKKDYDACNKWNFNSLTLRGSYQWIPSEFRIRHVASNNYDVHIETPISHLPMTEEYAQTYKNLEKVFSKLVPIFRRILSINNHDNDIRLQVIVKVQSYNIQPRTKYSGRWHTEGCTEHIQAVGVYYLYIDDNLEGGALKFRPAISPSKYYADHYSIKTDRYVMPETDAAIVFDNSLPHRFCSIRNSTSIARRRTFLNFFVVCPKYPIHELSILNLPLVSCEQCQIILKSIIDENHRQKLPDLVIEKILSFLEKNMWKTDTDAKEFRSHVRHEMVHENSGWSGIHYGNFGDIVFIKSANDLRQRKKQRDYREAQSKLIHTESD